MAQVQGARHVGRGDDHDELLIGWGLGRFRGVAGEEPLSRPPVIPCGFHGLRMIRLQHGLRHI
jgi:hypothetical protein